MHLHSTMYLLNQEMLALVMNLVLRFTFHYVSIKSFFLKPVLPDLSYLHSTMYLLNQAGNFPVPATHTFTFHYVSIKSSISRYFAVDIKIFTFHYVSIKSQLRPCR